MKALRSIIAATVLSLLALCSFAKSTVVGHAQRTTHAIGLIDPLGIQPTKCSATAVGPHALLTASHCELPTDEIYLDGEDTVQVEGILRDDNDHTIFFVSTEFKEWADFADVLPDVSDRFFIVGNPGAMVSVYREGYISGIEQAETQPFGEAKTILYLDMNGFHGDSGAAMFDADGKIIGVISTMYTQVSKDEGDHSQIKLMGAMQLLFTAKQKQEVTDWKPGNVIPKKEQPPVVPHNVVFKLHRK